MLQKSKPHQRPIDESTAEEASSKTANHLVLDERTEDINQEKSLSVNITDTIGEININSSENHLFNYQAAYPNEKIYNITYLPGDKGDLNVTNSFSSDRLFKQLKDRGQLDLSLASKIPLELFVKTGVGLTNLELSKLLLKKLRVATGASSLNLNFSEINQEKLELFELLGGANTVKARGLSNGNFELLNFDGGAGKYLFDFSGTLKRSGEVRLKCGASLMDLIIPDNIPAQINLSSTMTNMRRINNFERISESCYQNSAYGTNKNDPKLEIFIEAGLSSLALN